MVRRIDRTWAKFVDARFTDAHILEALGPGRRFMFKSTPTPNGTLYRVIGYADTDAGDRPVAMADADGVRQATLMVVEFLDVADRSEVALVTYVIEGDEEDFAGYG